MVYGLFRALPGDRACLPPSLSGMTSANLTPASGRQDHTSLPSASVPFVIGTSGVHRIPPHVRDDRATPLRRGGTAEINGVIWVGRKPKYFCGRGWTGRIALIRFEKFGCTRRCRSPDERSDIRENERLYPRVSVVSQFEFQLCVGGNGSYQASGSPDTRREC
jgi:hypothetical protein